MDRIEGVSTSLVDVTPDMARDWLANKNPRNRPVRNSVVSRYARDMANGAWLTTGEAIKFTSAGELIDGQHRLRAIDLSDVTLTLLVIRGLEKAAQDVMDTGLARRASDMLAIHGGRNTTLTAAAAKLAILYYDGRLHAESASRSVTHTDIMEFVRANADFDNTCATTNNLAKHSELRPSVFATALFICGEIDGEAADEFFTRLSDGVNLPAGSPIMALRSRARELRLKKVRAQPEVLLSATIRAWNAWREGRDMAMIPLYKGSSPIRCPEAK